jgi:hypothetical protein
MTNIGMATHAAEMRVQTKAKIKYLPVPPFIATASCVRVMFFPAAIQRCCVERVNHQAMEIQLHP